MSPLLRLPSELIDLVGENLAREDLLRFRQACKDIREKTLACFLQRFFEARPVMWERRSLSNLVKIAQHPILGPAVQTLNLSADHLVEIEDALYMERDEIEKREMRERLIAQATGHDSNRGDHTPEIDLSPQHREMYRQRREDQQALLQSGLDTAYLTSAMMSLRNCRSIALDDQTRPTIASTLAREVGIEPCRMIHNIYAVDESVEFVRHIVQGIFAALAAADLPIQELSIDLGFLNDYGGYISPDMLALPRALVIEARPSLLDLSTVILVVNPARWDDRSTDRPDRTWESCLVDFIELFPALSDLELSFYARDEYRRFSCLSLLLSIPTLRRVHLDCVDCTEDDLARFFLRHKSTLREIHLSCVDIVSGGGSWYSLACTVQDELQVDGFILWDCLFRGNDLRPRRISDTLTAGTNEGFTEMLNALAALEGAPVRK